jgi:lipopolysaccharide heptosyltransferase II
MKILIRFPNWLGDLVMSKGFYDKLRIIFEGASVFAIVKKEISELLYLYGGFEKIFQFSKKIYGSPWGIYQFSSKIKNNYDYYFSLPDSFSSALMGFFSNARNRIGYKKEMRSFLLTHRLEKPRYLHRVEEYAYLLTLFDRKPLENLKVEINVEPSTDILNLDSHYKIVLNINSEAQSRTMSIEKWFRVAKKLLENLDCVIILTGSKKEFHRNEKLKELLNSSNVINLAGKTNLIELSKILKAVDLVLSSDSGPAHLSNALGIKTIVLFGAGDERNTSPYNKQFLKVIKLENLKCSPCLKNQCKFGKPICLENLDESIIIKNVLEFLKA